MSAQPPPPPPPDDEWPTREDPALVTSQTAEVVEPVEPGPPPDRRVGLGLLLGLLLVGLVAAAIAAAWFLTRDDDKNAETTTVTTTSAPATRGRVEVPRLIGLKERDALLRLGEAGLRPREVYRPTAKPTKVVVAQMPAEATSVKRGSRVTLVIDSGAPRIAVPDVTGVKVDEAVKRLDAAGLDSQQTEVASDQPQGTVVDQAPAAGAKAAKGSAVTLSVAKAQPVTVPDVVGKSKADATAALENAGLKANAVTVPSDRPAGEVIAENPAAGTQVDNGATVRVNVSDGSGAAPTQTTQTTQTTTQTTTTAAPTAASVPDAAGSQLQAAATQLTRAGLLASVQYVPGEDPLGTVTAQSPKAGQTAKRRAHVTLSVSSGPGQKPQKTVPDTVGKTLDEAVSTVKGAGLRLIFAKLSITDRAQAGKVVEQTPAAGRTAPQNAQVLVYLGAFRG